MNRPSVAACLLGLAVIPYPSQADTPTRADSHAPIGLMGEHVHEAGEWMLSYRYMTMSMGGNRRSNDDVSLETIVTEEANPFFGQTGQPPTLRVVPTEMHMQMHMFGAMYAPNSRVTLMAMLNYVDKEMDHVTFMGGMGTTRLGEFTTKTRGLGDGALSALISLSKTPSRRVVATVGVTLPFGNLDATDTILTPMNTQASPRLPYPMQLGSGSFDPIVGVTYAANADRWSWGGQWRSVLRVADNDEAYRLGDEHRVGAWFGYLWSNAVSTSARLSWYERGNISGRDPLIVAPVQTADPDRQSARRIELSLGVNLLLAGNNRLALEVSRPLSQDLDGPQLETDWHVTAGYQYAF